MSEFIDASQINDEERFDVSLEEETFVFPVSFAQQRLWFLDQLEPNTALYTIPVALRLGGPLHVHALEQSIAEIVLRHESLRTTFTIEDGQPVQVITSPSLPYQWNLPVIDIQGCADLADNVERLAITEAQRPFDLSQGPLLRNMLLRLSSTEHVLLLTMHHIITDGWSIGVLLRELTLLYIAFSAGQPSPLPELAIQYVDYTLWQREWLQGEEQARQLTYWHTQLNNIPTEVSLPTDYPRPPIQTFHGAHQNIEIPTTVVAELKALCQKEDITLFMALLAVFQIVIFRYCGQTDIVVGTPIANRNRTEIEDLIGFFVNTLVLRSDLSGLPDFHEVARRTRKTALDAYANQDVPFEQVVNALQPVRDLARPPLFQILFVLQNTSSPTMTLADLIMQPLSVENGISRFDLTLSFTETEQGLQGSFEYNTDLFSATTITRLTRHFQTVLESVVAHPGQCIATLPMLTPTEIAQELVAWNQTDVAYPDTICIPELFEAQTRLTPTAIALIYQDQQLTYAQLNQQANQLAHYLQTLGVQAGVLVGICMERSLDMIVGLLGILKAGGAYVPLDPVYPQERLSFILQDTAAAVLLTQEKLREKIPASTATCIYMDTHKPLIDQQADNNLISTTRSDDIAYVIYTSGSTGRPKGVALAHRNTVTFLHWARDHFDHTYLQGVLASTSICFDLSIFEIFVPLSWGGTVILAENALELPTLPAAAQVKLINTVPSAMAELCT